ncbi:hypothetical protein Tco_0402094 [Tanacetum coccineum]
MRDENTFRTLGDYSKPSHEGYRNTIELPVGNNVVPLRSDTIRLVQNGCSFHELWSEDPNQHLKDFLKVVDSLDLDGENRERTRLFFIRSMDSFQGLTPKVPHHGIHLWLQVQYFYDHVNPVTRRTIDQSAGGKLRDQNTKESWALLEDLALYDNESWNNPRDFAKLVKWSLRHSVLHGRSEQAFVEYASSHTDEAGGLVSNFMASQDARLSKFEADFKQQQSEMTNKINTVLKAITDQIASTLPSDTVKNPKLSTYPVLSARSYPTEDPQCLTQTHSSINAITIHTEQQSASYDDGEKENKEEEDDPENIHVNPPTPPDPSVTLITKKASNSIHSSNHSDWFPSHPILN